MTSVQRHRQTEISSPSSTTRAMADLTAKFTNRLEDHPGDFRRKLISASLAPTGAEREALESRRRELATSLTPTPGDKAEAVITLLIAGAPAFGMTERESDVKARLYAEALRGEPTWAINQARQRFATGGWVSPWNGTGCPSSANVVAECRAIVLPIEAEIHKIGQILDAEPVDTSTTPAQREQGVALWERVKSDIGRSNVIAQRTAAEIDAERAAQKRANERFRPSLEAERKSRITQQSETEGRGAL